MSKRDELIFWFDQPPKVSLGAFNHVSNNWGNTVLYIADHGFGEHRKLINWDNSDYGKAQLLLLSEQENEQDFIKGIFQKYPNAIHIMNGFFSTIEKKIRPFVKNKNVKLVVTTERPFVTKSNTDFKQTVKNYLLPIKYRISKMQYDKYVKALLPLGICGVDCFKSYGWKESKVFPYMYCTELADLGEESSPRHDKVKFLYVGRFTESRLGVLIKAFDLIEQKDGWSLDLVGGYGNYLDTTMKWIDTQPNVNYGGLWPAEEVGRRMMDFDVYLLATGYEGWNVQLNEAINAGMAVVATDEAVSDEMVSASGGGLVVKAGNVSEFKAALDKAISNPEIVEKWKNNSRAYKSRIQGGVVGDYLINILDYSFYERKEKPNCPWLNKI